MGCLRAAGIDRRFHLRKKKRQQPEKPTAGVIVADRVGFEPTSRLRDYLISSVVRLWQIHVWSRPLWAALLRGRNADAARGCGHSDPYRPEAIRTAPKFK